MTTEPEAGVCVLVADCAFGLATDTGMVVDTDFGQAAFGHGTYVRPQYRQQGLSKLIRDRVREELRARGFQTVIGGLHLQNDVAVRSLDHTGFTAYMLLGYERL